MRSSYKEEDVVLLLKDITGLVQPQPTEERERLIQAGKHYSEMLPIEYVPSGKYMEIYEEALRNYALPTAQAVGVLADKVMGRRGKEVVLVSLARAGIPIGILLKRYIKFRYGVDTPHYAISIIKGRGIDKNAMAYLAGRYRPGQLLFVDGWVGKGAILKELQKALSEYGGVSPEIAVLADPANVTGLCGTHEDILIPSSCLNSTVSGLVSRTFLRDDIIGEKDFHGAVYYGELEDADLSYEFIHAIEREFGRIALRNMRDGRNAWDEVFTQDGMGMEGGTDLAGKSDRPAEGVAENGRHIAGGPGAGVVPGSGLDEVREIAGHFGIRDLNLVKPGIGETTRVLLRRVPWKVLVDGGHEKDPELAHILRLAEEKGVPVECYPLRHYRTCGLIKEL